MTPDLGVVSQSLDLAFAWVVRATVQAAVVVVLVISVRRALYRRISPGARYALWLLLALPLIAPLLPVIPIRLPRLASVVATDRPPTILTHPASASTGWRIEYEPLDGAQVPRATVIPPRRHNWLRIAAVAWLIGATALAFRVAVTHSVAVWQARRWPALTHASVINLLDDCRRTVRTGRAVRIVAAPDDTGPALLGVFRPRLLLPRSLPQRLSPSELRFVLLHELVHLKRGDVLAEWLLTLLQVVHWFNPLVWLAAACCRADREIACDAAVISLTGPSRRAEYGRTILRLATELSPAHRFARPRALAPAVGILETHTALERRLRMIALAPDSKPARWASGIVVFLALAAVTCTNAQTRPPDHAAKPQLAAPPAPSPAPAKQESSLVDVSNAPATAPDIQVPRTVAEEREYQAAAKNKLVRDLLDRPLPEVKFDGAGFTDVIDFLRDVSGANIFVNWKALEAAGVDRNAAITARLRVVTFGKALQIVLDSAGGKTKLGFTVDDGVITVSTDDDLLRDTITRVYDVRDLVTPIRNFDFDPTAPAKEDEKNKEDPGATRAQAADELMRLIRETVEPERWGKMAQMRELQGQLIVTATKEMHETIVQLVEQLRSTRGLQIEVDARFIGADDDVLDALPDGLRQKVAGALHARKKGAPDGKAAATAPADREKVVYYLDDGEVDELLRVVRANRNAEFVSAPRITLFNGQTAYVLTATQRNYVVDYKIVKQPDGKTSYEPSLATADAGVLLRAGATASADRKYATLTLHPRLTYLAGMDEAPWRGNAPGEDLKVQVPRQLVSELGTTVSVPDRGTILLGGLHGYVATGDAARDKEPRVQNVIMLVKPTLIAQKEIEAAQFPLLQKNTKVP